MTYPDEHEQSLLRPEWLSFTQHWERGLLLLLVGGILAMAVNLLWPKPQAVISLQPYVASLPQVAGVSETVSTENEAAPSEEAAADDQSANAAGSQSLAQVAAQPHPKRGTHPRYPKKPAHPPVTNLNTAKVQQLQLLPGIGPKMAERILEYRKANGGFKTVEQVMDVKGIGPKKFEKMKAFLKV